MRTFSRRCVLAAIVGVLGLLAKSSAADEAPPPLAAVSAREGEPFADQVDPRTGAMTYAYRFDLPAARGISGPSLGLQYNSSTHDREAGYGWGLDLPSIELRPLAGLPRFAGGSGEPLPLDRERYAFGGQSLVKICVVGAGCPAEPSTQGHPDWATGWTYYRLQLEGLFARFYRSGNNATWRVQFKGGEVVDFGTPVGESYGMPAAVEHKSAGHPGIVRWWPVARRDLQHPNNVVLYRWSPYGTRGIMYLTDIYDTPSLGSPTSLGAFAHHTQLSWEGTSNPAGNHQSPERAIPDWRLVRVDISSMPWSGVGPREVYKTYRLDYLAARTVAYDPATQAPLFHHDFLKRIRVSGHCRGQYENGDGSVGSGVSCGQELPALHFEYETAAQLTLVGSAAVSLVHCGPPAAAANYDVLPFPASAGIVDFDRDGLPDVIQSWEAPTRLGRKVAVRASGVSGEPELYSLQNFRPASWPATGTVGDGPSDFSIRSARPILGYQNRGSNGPTASAFRFQCMDAGDPLDTASVLMHSAQSAATQQTAITQFFNAGSNTVLGAFGRGLGVWGRNGYMPFYARSLGQPTFEPGTEPPNFALGGCSLHTPFDSSAFFPRWQWESGIVESWTRPAQRSQTRNIEQEWFVDIDGVILPRFGGQSDYAAIMDICIFNSNSIGLT